MGGLREPELREHRSHPVTVTEVKSGSPSLRNALRRRHGPPRVALTPLGPHPLHQSPGPLATPPLHVLPSRSALSLWMCVSDESDSPPRIRIPGVASGAGGATAEPMQLAGSGFGPRVRRFPAEGRGEPPRPPPAGVP